MINQQWELIICWYCRSHTRPAVLVWLLGKRKLLNQSFTFSTLQFLVRQLVVIIIQMKFIQVKSIMYSKLHQRLELNRIDVDERPFKRLIPQCGTFFLGNLKDGAVFPVGPFKAHLSLVKISSSFQQCPQKVLRCLLRWWMRLRLLFPKIQILYSWNY